MELHGQRVAKLARRRLFQSGGDAHRGGFALAGLLSILTTLGRVTARDLQQLGKVTGNNFFLFTFLAIASGGAFLQLVLGLLVLFPLSSDPLSRIPADRLRLWPLSTRDHLILRAASLAFSPPAWIAVALLVWTSKPAFALLLTGIAVIFYLLGSLFGALPSRPIRYLPGGLTGKNLRELLSVLDPYLALVLSGSGSIYRFAGKDVDSSAFLVLTLLIVLALSTYALCLFGLDTASGFTRYHLLPLPGWRILLAKDLAWMMVLIPLVLPLAPVAGIAAGLMALAVGHHSSVTNLQPQTPWRFTGGAPIGPALLQVFLMFSVGTLAYRASALVLLPCLAAFLGSLWWYGRTLDQSQD